MQIQKQTRLSLKRFDDSFHVTIIALERLEYELDYKNKAENSQVTKAIKTDRDLHDDIKLPPNKESVFSEMIVQCLALVFQSNFDDDKKNALNIAKFFLNDLFSWYGGRKNIEANEVEKFALPIISTITRYLKTAKEVDEVIKKYVEDNSIKIEKLNQADEEKVILEGLEGLMKAGHIVENKEKEFLEKTTSGRTEDIEFTKHERGTINEGYIHLYTSFEKLYPDDKTPNTLLLKVIEKYLPELLNK